MMQRTWIRRAAAAVLIVLTAFCLAKGTAALDSRYRFDQFEMSIGVPRNYDVITRSTKKDDPVFAAHNLNYDQTIAAFKIDNIYLQAYDPDGVFWVNLCVTSDTQSKDINNYYDISASVRKEILDALKANDTVTSAVEVKHGDNLFLDSTSVMQSGGRTIYIAAANTIINGYRIDLMLYKYDEDLLAGEKRVLSNLANSLEFDRIVRKTGPIFEWWRLVLWVAVLGGVAFVCTFLYRQRNAANRRRLEERRRRHQEALAGRSGEADTFAEDGMTFEEALGYQDHEQYKERVSTDLDSLDISVKDKNPKNGIAYFEDGGESIDDGTDYFDTYFSEPAEARSGASRFFSAVGTYIKIAAKHTAYFFKNLFRTLFRRKKKPQQ